MGASVPPSSLSSPPPPAFAPIVPSTTPTMRPAIAAAPTAAKRLRRVRGRRRLHVASTGSACWISISLSSSAGGALATVSFSMTRLRASERLLFRGASKAAPDEKPLLPRAARPAAYVCHTRDVANRKRAASLPGRPSARSDGRVGSASSRQIAALKILKRGGDLTFEGRARDSSGPVRRRCLLVSYKR